MALFSEKLKTMPLLTLGKIKAQRLSLNLWELHTCAPLCMCFIACALMHMHENTCHMCFHHM